MRIRIAVVMLAVMALAAAPLAAQSSGWTVEDTMKVRPVGTPQVSPDGKRVVFTVNAPVMTAEKSEYLTHIWMAAADGSDSFQFTYGDKSCSNPQWSPNGEWIAFTTSRSGKNNIWLIRATGGEAEQLTDVKSGVASFQWAPDGKSIAFIMPDPPTDEEEKANKARDDANVVDEDFKFNHLYVIPISKGEKGKREARRLTKGEFHVGGSFAGGWDWAPDGKSIAFTHTPTPRVNDWTLADISIVDVVSGQVRAFQNTGAAEGSPNYSPDGRWIAFTRSDDPPTWGFTSHVYVVATSGGPEASGPRRLGVTHDEQPGIIGWSADGTWVYFSETNGTVTRLSALPVDGGAPRALNMGGNFVLGVSLNHTRTAFGLSAQSWDSPPEAYVTPADRWTPVKISRVNAEIPKHPLGRTEVIRWKAPDGREIEGLLTYPVGYEAGKRYPMVLVIHGGPAGVFTQSFIASRTVYPTAVFAAQGWAVLRANIRGSSGYGREFRYANYKDWGGADYRDLMAGVDHVISLGVADANRLGVMGWSYGGFMTSWVITQTKRFQAASIGAPVTNLMSFNGTADIPGFVPDYFGAEFWDNLEVYRRHSAMFNIKGASTPSLIQHGERDERVPIGQGYELYTALRRQGVTAKMVTYPRQPHGLSEPRHVMHAARDNLAWFTRFLGGGK